MNQKSKDPYDDSGKEVKEKQQVLSLISKYTKHKDVKLVQRGNAAIFCALVIAKKFSNRKTMIIPDQGGWISFNTYPGILGFETKIVKTDRGLIDLEDLDNRSRSAAAFLVTSFAGYIAEQDMKKISEVCRKNNCLLIEDASGAIGDDVLCDGNFSDIIVGSFGEWKPVNVGYGGFISVAKKEYFDKSKEIFSTTNHYPKYDVLFEKLKCAKERIDSMVKRAEEVKKEISKEYPKLDVMHKSSRGLNVAVAFRDDEEKKIIEGYCDEKGFDWLECPDYKRVNENAVIVELKRSD